MRKKFEVELVRCTYEYVTITVEEDDVETAGHATDYINDRLRTDWDPAPEGGDPKFGHWEINEVTPPDPPPGSKTQATIDGCEAARIPVENRSIDPSELTAEDLMGLPVVTREEGDATPAMTDRLVLPEGMSMDEFRKGIEGSGGSD